MEELQRIADENLAFDDDVVVERMGPGDGVDIILHLDEVWT